MATLDALRREEYTGDRRCWPCTIGNGVILLGICGAVALVAGYVLALVLGAVGATTIALRGYLFPYTPRFAPFFKRMFGGVGPRTSSTEGGSLADVEPTAGDPDEEELLSELIVSGVLHVDGERLRLSSAIENQWREEMERLRDLSTERLLGEVEEISPASRVRVPEHTTGSWIVLSDGTDALAEETWLSRPGAIAEVAAAHALEGHVQDPIRLPAARSMRTFLTACPECGTTLEETSAASCCGGYPDPKSVPDVVAACPECDVWLYRIERSA